MYKFIKIKNHGINSSFSDYLRIDQITQLRLTEDENCYYLHIHYLGGSYKEVYTTLKQREDRLIELNKILREY